MAGAACHRRLRRSWRQADNVGSGIPNQPPKLFGVLSIAIDDQIPLGMQRARLRISHIASNLKHPRFVCARRDPRNLHSVIGKAEHEQQVSG
jgi:hypothetical protein